MLALVRVVLGDMLGMECTDWPWDVVSLETVELKTSVGLGSVSTVEDREQEVLLFRLVPFLLEIFRAR